MAYYLKLRGISSSEGTDDLSMEPDWWQMGDNPVPNVKLNWVAVRTPGYTDYKADLLLDDVRALHLWFRPKLLERIEYNRDCLTAELSETDNGASDRARQYQDYLSESETLLATLDTVLADGATQYSQFELRQVEWESGYG